MTETVVLTGATGFVGSQILRALIERGCQVRVIKRPGSALPEWVDQNCIEIAKIADLFAASTLQLETLVAGCDTLLHSAWYAEPGQYLYSPRNVDCLIGTLRLAQAFQASGGRRFVGIGTCFEYDVDAGWLKTDTPLLPKTPYAAAKVSAFQMLTQLLPPAGQSFAWCRLFYLYGEGEDARRLVPYLRTKLAAGEIAELTSGRQIRDFLDVREAGERIAAVALSDQQGPVNICSGQPIRVRELAERIADEIGRRDLLRFDARPDHPCDPPCIIGSQCRIAIANSEQPTLVDAS